jgi:hypothetical protein
MPAYPQDCCPTPQDGRSTHFTLRGNVGRDAIEWIKTDAVFDALDLQRLQPTPTRAGFAIFEFEVRIPTKPATHSNRKPATDSDLKPAGVPI